jgi:CDP-archaeol synthase
MGHCSRCGQQLMEGMAFCGKCGAAVNQSQPDPAGPGAPSAPPQSQPQPQQVPQPQQQSDPEFATSAPARSGPWAGQISQQPDSLGREPEFSWTIPLTVQDAIRWLRGAAILLGVALASGFVLAFLIGLLLPGANHGNPADWLCTGLLLAGMALGGRAADTATNTDPSIPGIYVESVDVRVSVLLITIAVLLTVRFLARRSERCRLSPSLRELTFTAVGTGVVFAAVMALLALAVHIHAFYGVSRALPVQSDPLNGPPAGTTGFTLRLSAVSMFLWPLLLLVAVWWGSAFAFWLRTRATTAPTPTSVRLAWLWTCRPAFLAVRAQILATMVLGGVGVYVYAVIDTLRQSSPGGGGGAVKIVLALLLALPNLAAVAGTVALGAPVTGLGSVFGAMGLSSSPVLVPGSSGYGSTLSITPGVATSIGFFGDRHPALIYLLIVACVLGTAGAAKWAVGRSWERGRALLGPGQAWRGIVLGALCWLAVGFAVQVSENISNTGLGGSTSLTIGPSLTGLLLAGAVWGLATCLAMSYFAGHLTGTPLAAQPGPIGQPGLAVQPDPTAQPGAGSPTGADGDPGAAATAGSPAQAQPDDPCQGGYHQGEDVIDMGTIITLVLPDPQQES